MKKILYIPFLIVAMFFIGNVDIQAAEQKSCTYYTYKTVLPTNTSTKYKLTYDLVKNENTWNLKNCKVINSENNSQIFFREDCLANYAFGIKNISKTDQEVINSFGEAGKCFTHIRLDRSVNTVTPGLVSFEHISVGNEQTMNNLSNFFDYEKYSIYYNGSWWLQQYIFSMEATNDSNVENKLTKYQEDSLNVKLYDVVTCGDIELPDGLVDLISTGITILQIAVPLVLVIMGMLDFAKATIASKEDDMKKAQQSFIRRLIAGAAVFFVIFISEIVVGIINTDDSNQALVCVDKILNKQTSTEKKVKEQIKEVANETADECTKLYNSGGNWKQCICRTAITVYNSSQEYKDTGELLDSEIPNSIKNNTTFLKEFEKYSNATSNVCEIVTSR